MKTIFVFDDSRVTDSQFHVVALGEDGEAVAVVKFDEWMYPHRRFAMAIDNRCNADIRTVLTANNTREDITAGFNAVFGHDKWIAVWVDEPKKDIRCLDALRAMHAVRDERAKQRSAELANIVCGSLGALFKKADAPVQSAI
jgi:hypothetical protein